MSQRLRGNLERDVLATFGSHLTAAKRLQRHSGFVQRPESILSASQANLMPAHAAALWPQLEKVADKYGLRLGSPSASNCGGDE